MDDEVCVGLLFPGPDIIVLIEFPDIFLDRVLLVLYPARGFQMPAR